MPGRPNLQRADRRGRGSSRRIDEVTRSASRAFLAAALRDAAGLESEHPGRFRLSPGWLARGHQQTTTAYRSYLDGRHAGAPRRLSHALARASFIKSVAPNKLVDGAWLYGLLRAGAMPGLHRSSDLP